MSDFKLHILGCGSALPTQKHLPTAQMLELRGKLYLIDCGEGTQNQIRRQGLCFESIKCIFITHHHGDHIFGLPGLLASLSMLGRTQVLQIVGPRGTKELIAKIQEFFLDWIQFQLVVSEYDDRVSQPVFEDKSLSVQSIPLSHKLPCQGYLFREKTQTRHIDRASCDFYGVPLSAYKDLLVGKDWLSPYGDCIPNNRLTRPGVLPRSYAVCTDTEYLPKLHTYLEGVDTLYHESTFLEREQERAKLTKHSTAREAALVAQAAGVKRLLLGHYSARYKTTKDLLQEAREVFPDTIATNEGMTIEL